MPNKTEARHRRRHHSPPHYLFQPVRTRLLADLERAAQERTKVLSIVAPIGYGKTVLMSEFHAHLAISGEHCFWVGLDERDATLARVLRSVEAALVRADADFHPAQALFVGDATDESRINGILEIIERLPDHATIFIDNFNSCTDENLGAFLDALIFRTPPSVCFVWSSTISPGIDLGRAKLEGLIRQVGFADLSLDAREAGELLGADIESRIGAAGMAAVLAQTEGWPAAIRMAQIALADSDRPLAALRAFSGSDEDIAALLNRQVLKGFEPDLREFLLRLSLLHHFSVEMCRHATGYEDAERHLEFLLRRNVFVIPLDRNRRQYRLHGLFREYLLSEATRSLKAGTRAEVQRRAADWCERHSEWQEAIDYALASGDAASASRLLDRTATIFLRDRGDIQQYIDWVERLESEKVQIGWEGHFWYVWALMFRRRYELGRMEHQKLADRLHTHAGETDAPPNDLPQRIEHLRLCIDLFTDRMGDVDRGAERWLKAGPTNDPYNLASVHCIRSVCLASAYKFAQARKALSIAEPIMREVSGAYTEGWISLIYATMQIYEGNYADAFKDLQSALRRMGEALGEDSILCDTLSFAAAKCAVEMGLDDQARSLFLAGLRTAHSHGLVDTTASGFDAGIKLWSGDQSDDISIADLRRIAISYPPRLSLMLSCHLVQRLLRLGRLQDALAEAARIGLGPEKDRTVEPNAEALTVARSRDLFAATAIDLHIALGQFRAAEGLIAEGLRTAQAEGRGARSVELRLARAGIALRSGRVKPASRDFALALTQSTRQRIVRPFRDHAQTVTGLVDNTRPSSWPFALSEQREFFAEICGGLPVQDAAPRELAARAPDSALQSLPTRREIELLQLVHKGLSNEQIADQTNSSINTIKWHFRNLYKKFGVSNRSAALARARSMGLLF